MKVSIQNILSASSIEWDEIWKKCDYSTYFHSREWSEIWSAYTGGRMKPDPKLLVFSDYKKALLPLSSQKNFKGLTKSYISSPAGTFGGWISTDDLDAEHGVLLAGYLTKRLGNLFWRFNPYDTLVFQAGVSANKDDETQTLNLASGFDAIHKGWTKGHRYAARTARKKGVWIRPASTLDDWHTYYEVYEDSLRRWGNKASSKYGWTLFNYMFQCNSPDIKLWLAIYQDKVVAGALCFYAKKHVVYWQGAALEDYFHLSPVNLLLFEAIKDACEQGYNWFDFNPSGGHEGVKAFKKSFGTEPLPCPIVSIDSNLVRISKNITAAIRRWKL